MHKFINNQIPSIFSDVIKRPDHKYPTNFSHSRFYLKRYSLNSTKYSISIRGLKLWNDVINKEEEDIQSYSLFQISFQQISFQSAVKRNKNLTGA